MNCMDTMAHMPTRIAFGLGGGSAFNDSPVQTGSSFPAAVAVSQQPAPPGTDFLRTAGYFTAGDGGGGLYKRTAAEPGHAGKLQSLDSVWFELVAEDAVWPEQFGARRDGIQDDTAALQAAADAISAMPGADVLHLRAGTYRMDATVTVPANVSLIGTSGTVLDGRGALGANLTDSAHLVTAPGTLIPLTALSADIARNGRTLTFTAPPSAVAEGDVLVIYDAADYSFSGFRSYYRAGEYVRVAQVSGSQITIHGSFADDYVAANVTVYRMSGTTTAVFRDFEVRGLADPTRSIRALLLNNPLDSEIRNVRARGASHSGLMIKNGFNVEIAGCFCEDDLDPVGGTDYGLVIANSQSVRVSGGYFNAGRHGITLGGAGETGDVTCRYISITGAHIVTSGDLVQALNSHGNTEYLIVDGCILDGGMTMGGDHLVIKGNTIRGRQYNGPTALALTELRGTNVALINNSVESDQTATGRGNLIDIGGNSNVISASTRRGGELIISGNALRYTGADRQTALISINQRGYAGVQPVDVRVSDNTFHVTDTADPPPDSLLVELALFLRRFSGDAYRTVHVTGNTGEGGLHIQNQGTGDTAAETVLIAGNQLRRGKRVMINDCSRSAYIRDNGFERMRYESGYAGELTSPASAVHITGNTFLDCAWGWQSSSVTRSAVRAVNAGSVLVRGNVVLGRPERLEFDAAAGITGSFVIGETVTGASSAATATLHEITGQDRAAVLQSASGVFQAGEQITGAISGAVATLQATAPVASMATYALSLSGITELWRDQNIISSGLPVYLSGIGTDHGT